METRTRQAEPDLAKDADNQSPWVKQIWFNSKGKQRHTYVNKMYAQSKENLLEGSAKLKSIPAIAAGHIHSRCGW